ncbi:MAG: alkaline phosphatase family protein, partial [Pararheinheimera sp.]|nr:alkaline phosphatase family protein [Rheinheimera sp.]
MSKAARCIPLVWAGPLLRRLTPGRICLWLATSEQVELKLQLQPEQGEALQFDAKQLQPWVQQLQLAGKLYLYFLDLELSEALPTEHWISYDL